MPWRSWPWPDDLNVMMDFELAMRQAWRHLHPSHNVKGCLFHLANVSPQILTHSNPPSIPIILATLEEGLRMRIFYPLQRIQFKGDVEDVDNDYSDGDDFLSRER